MTHAQAFAKAQAQFGFDAVVGENQQKSNRYYVGARTRGDWVAYGTGSSWEEAFQNVKGRKRR